MVSPRALKGEGKESEGQCDIIPSTRSWERTGLACPWSLLWNHVSISFLPRQELQSEICNYRALRTQEARDVLD